MFTLRRLYLAGPFLLIAAGLLWSRYGTTGLPGDDEITVPATVRATESPPTIVEPDADWLTQNQRTGRDTISAEDSLDNPLRQVSAPRDDDRLQR